MVEQTRLYTLRRLKLLLFVYAVYVILCLICTAGCWNKLMAETTSTGGEKKQLKKNCNKTKIHPLHRLQGSPTYIPAKAVAADESHLIG